MADGRETPSTANNWLARPRRSALSKTMRRGVRTISSQFRYANSFSYIGCLAAKRTFALFTLASLIVLGCSLGDPIAVRTVSLKFRGSDVRAGQHLPTDGSKVKGALQLIDEVFVSYGFAQDSRSPAPEDRAQGIVASYGRYTVSFKDDILTVHFVEFGQSRSSPIVRKVSKALTEKLSTRYGVQNVEVDQDVQNITVK